MQSSRKRFGLKHREGDLCWSLSESEGRKEKAECHKKKLSVNNNNDTDYKIRKKIPPTELPDFQ